MALMKSSLKCYFVLEIKIPLSCASLSLASSVLLIQSKPGQHFLVGFRNRALVITEQVLANIGLVSKGLCLLSAHRNSMKTALEVN